jgi:hypothetical protein
VRRARRTCEQLVDAHGQTFLAPHALPQQAMHNHVGVPANRRREVRVCVSARDDTTAGNCLTAINCEAVMIKCARARCTTRHTETRSVTTTTHDRNSVRTHSAVPVSLAAALDADTSAPLHTYTASLNACARAHAPVRRERLHSKTRALAASQRSALANVASLPAAATYERVMCLNDAACALTAASSDAANV